MEKNIDLQIKLINIYNLIIQYQFDLK